MPPKNRKTPAAQAAATVATPQAPKKTTKRSAVMPAELFEAMVGVLETLDFKKVEHVLIPVRMGAVRLMTTDVAEDGPK